MKANGAALEQNRAETAWEEANQTCLALEFSRLRLCLGRSGTESPQADLRQLRESMRTPPAIDILAAIFGLSRFERDLLLLCAGVEMNADLAATCAEMAGLPQRNCVTFGLALSTLEEPHWTALAPLAPLRRFRLIDTEARQGVTSSLLRIDERILHFLAGVNLIDTRLEGLLQSRPQPIWAADEHRALAAKITAKLESESGEPPLLHLYGDDYRGQEDVAALVADNIGRDLLVLRQGNLSAPGADLDQFIQLWRREALLLPAILLVQLESSAPNSSSDQLIERLPGPFLIASRDLLPRPPQRRLEGYEVNKPRPTAQKTLWQRTLGAASANLNGHLDELAEQFCLSAETIHSVARSILGSPDAPPSLGNTAVAGENQSVAARLWEACRAVSRPRLESLAKRIGPGSRTAAWDDLILPDAQKQILHQMSSQLRHRLKVYEEWGFASRGRRGLGLSALFAGPSGTGKTMAAEVLAAELELDLYRIDLSAVVSKYIGETEKNLRQIFDAAESGGVLLLFDEADALFSKRSDVKDSRDRYANIEVSYLLQRMESFAGLAILTSNLKSVLDKAFQRRLRFIVDFAFPDPAQREAIWTRIFPEKTPTRGLDFKRLAQLNMTGGNIRNIALNAAFLAAEAGKPVEMAHVLQATRLEAIKTERPLAEMEIRGWV